MKKNLAAGCFAVVFSVSFIIFPKASFAEDLSLVPVFSESRSWAKANVSAEGYPVVSQAAPDHRTSGIVSSMSSESRSGKWTKKQWLIFGGVAVAVVVIVAIIASNSGGDGGGGSSGRGGGY
jgi:hypothetical protein